MCEVKGAVAEDIVRRDGDLVTRNNIRFTVANCGELSKIRPDYLYAFYSVCFLVADFVGYFFV